ncbi:hypothetical protein CDAR_461771 [Caerostris darwini]|uniref:Uncharacterized protein n=1 Tax=Caerostris darwini TaxID=1538125 RepID=A0AAV4TC86_9ARAC|nr:hypothetical protein CDAR_461771 [Caerostris darwini]
MTITDSAPHGCYVVQYLSTAGCPDARELSIKGRGPCRCLRTNGRHTRAQVMCYPGESDRRSAVGREEEEWAVTTTRRMPTVVALKDPAPLPYVGALVKTRSKSHQKLKQQSKERVLIFAVGSSTTLSLTQNVSISIGIS